MPGTELAREPETTQRPRLLLPALVCSLLLAAELYAIFFDLGRPSGTYSSNRPVIATFRNGVNEVRSRSAGTITWSVPSAGAQLRREDAILTLADARANIEFNDGALLDVEPDSLVLLEKSEAGASGKIVLRLIDGSISKKKAGTAPIAVDFEDKAKGIHTRIEDAVGDALFHLKRDADGVSVHVENGSIKIGDGKDAKTVGAFQEAKISREATRVTEVPLRFEGLAPDTATVGREKDDEKVSLGWRQKTPGGGDARDHRVKAFVSRHSDLRDAVEADVDELSARFEPKDDGTYFWQLRTEDGALKSPVASFTLVTKTEPAVEGPDDDTNVIVGQGVVYRWKQRKGVSVFVETSPDDEFKTPTRLTPPPDHGGIETSYEQPQTLYWRLRADYGPGLGLSAPSEARKLVVRPKPLLKAPKSIKAKVRIETGGLDRAYEWMRWLAALAEPAPAPRSRKIRLEIEWESVEGADQYRLQIAPSSDFSKVTFDRKIRQPSYSYRTEQTEEARTVYFRIASVDATGTEGPFSEPEEIEIEALPPPEVKKPVPKPTPTPSPTPTAPAEKPVVLTTEEQENRGRFQLSLSA
ncbi:MAG: hypothetical protein HY075_14935, partial [Deltaproteobacteria bacterium]|nr:hypothetical protein [Deltaproteobacteria bacterium]